MNIFIMCLMIFLVVIGILLFFGCDSKEDVGVKMIV